MLASGRFFALMLGEGEELVPVLNRAVDCIGALALALMFSTIDEEIRIKSKLATKSDGGLRTRGGVAIQVVIPELFSPIPAIVNEQHSHFSRK